MDLTTKKYQSILVVIRDNGGAIGWNLSLANQQGRGCGLGSRFDRTL